MRQQATDQQSTSTASFQPISSESGLRLSTNPRRVADNALFNPYPAKADCDKSIQVRQYLGDLLFNPYPAKADCDRLWQSPISIHCTFSTHIQRKRIATLFYFYLRINGLSFQPISSESGLRPPNLNQSDLRLSLFNPYPAKADCDRDLPLGFHRRSNFSTHIQRKRIATIIKLFMRLYTGFSTHIQRKRIATGYLESSKNLRLTFQPISSESGLRLHYLVRLLNARYFSTHIQRKRIATYNHFSWYPSHFLFNPYPAKADCDLTNGVGVLNDYFLFNPYPAKADCDSKCRQW